MGKGSDQVIGFRYYVGMHQVYGLSPRLSPISKALKIRVGEKVVWGVAASLTADETEVINAARDEGAVVDKETGLAIPNQTSISASAVAANTRVYINVPNIFGGDKKEGGVQGFVDIEFGAPTQPINSYLASVFTGKPQSAYRGLMALVLNRTYLASLNPYLKPWSMYLSRINGGFLPAKAAIGDDMNPAHIIYEVLTSTAFGIGVPFVDVDTVTFTNVANTLFAEGFGLSYFWNGEQSAEEFITYICQHIDASIYVNPSSGKIELVLVRNDFVFANLRVLGPSNILSVDSFSQPMPGELTSEVQVKFEDQVTGTAGSVTAQDIAILELQGGSGVPVVRDYQALPNAARANKVALRELRQLATPLARAEIIATREAWDLRIGQPFRLQWPSLGIVDMVMRVIDIDLGTLSDGRVTITTLQDVFSTADTVIAAPPTSGWVNPTPAPAPCPLHALIEAPYWVVARELLRDSDTLINEVDPLSGLALSVGNRPSVGAYNYTQWTKSSGSYVSRVSGGFCPTAILSTAIGQADTVLSVNSFVDISFLDIGTWAILEGEIIKIISFNISTVTVRRGILDTVSVAHASGAVIYFGDGFKAVDPTEWSSGQTISAKLLVRTGLGTLLEAAAPVDTVVMAARFNRPYPPGNTKVNTVEYPTTTTGDLAISWAHRSRRLQTAYLVEQSEASIGPEADTTYTVRIYNAQVGGTLLRTYALIAAASQVYTAAQATTDNGGTLPANVRVEVEAVRGGVISRQSQKRAFAWS